MPALATELLPLHLRQALQDTLEEIVTLEAPAHGVRDQLDQLAQQLPDAALLQSGPGSGS
jgi:hypothetical protein